MEYVNLGRSGLKVSRACLGAMNFGTSDTAPTSEADARRIIDAFLDAGNNFIDTANVYTGGQSEQVVGRAVAGKRDKVVIATKVGMELGEGQTGLSAKWITRAVEDSLKRLQTDYIDLYQSHRDDPGTPQAETGETYAALVKAGKVRFVGASNFEPARLASAVDLAEANGWPRYETLQPLYNLYDRAGFESALADLCADRDIGVIPFYGLASGFLTGKYKSQADLAKSPRGRTAAKYLNDRGLAIVAALEGQGARLGATAAQVALAWLMTKVAAPIASATSVAQLQELVAAAKLSLDAEAMRALEDASAELAPA